MSKEQEVFLTSQILHIFFSEFDPDVLHPCTNTSPLGLPSPESASREAMSREMRALYQMTTPESESDTPSCVSVCGGVAIGERGSN